MDSSSLKIPGFLFSAVPAGLKKSGALDAALVFSEKVAVTSALFTTNKIKAAPVKLSIRRIRSKKGQALIINSGNANACTGAKGDKDAEVMTGRTALALGIKPDLVYGASTGVIGRPFPVQKITNAIPALVEKLSPLNLQDVASAIMTTDTFAKISFRKIKIGGRTGTIAGVAKGAGMICPNMATMLCFIFTDIAVTPAALDSALREAVRGSFNRMSVDNDMSTNDTVMIMANGSLQNTPVSKISSVYGKFGQALQEVTQELADMIVRDGEGATKFIEIIVKGAKTEADADKAARAVANSMLVKTALYGQDPNWGRIIAAVGYSGAEVNENRIDIFLNGIKLVSRGTGTNKESAARDALSANRITITVNLGVGAKGSKIITCDLTEQYIKINAHYTT